MKELTKKQKKIMLEKGTEMPFTGKYWNHKEKGIYKCAQCGQPLFSSLKKYDSMTGWPSFTACESGAIGTQTDKSFMMTRTEVHCSKCGGHLGHLFGDGPPPSNKRFCINSAALEFQKK